MVLNVVNDGHSIKPKIEIKTKTASNSVTAVHHQRFVYKFLTEIKVKCKICYLLREQMNTCHVASKRCKCTNIHFTLVDES